MIDPDSLLFPGECFLADLLREESAYGEVPGRNPSVGVSSSRVPTVYVTAAMRKKRAKEVPAKEHINNPIFDPAKQKEVAGLFRKDDPSLEVTPQDSAGYAIPMRWVITWKLMEDGTWQPKARLVVIGFRDRGKHLIETSADTPARESTKLLIHFAVQTQSRLNKWDSKQAFLGFGRARPWKRNIFLFLLASGIGSTLATP